jgi:hypothetical protein
MPDGSTSSSPRVVKVASGLESTDRHVPVRDMQHEALDVPIGINEGRTVATAEIPSVPILTAMCTSGRRAGSSSCTRPMEDSRVERWWGGDHRSGRRRVRLHVLRQLRQRPHLARGDRWQRDSVARERTRCTATLTDGGMTQVAHHESSPTAWCGARRWNSRCARPPDRQLSTSVAGRGQVIPIVAASAIRWSFDHGGPNVARGP